MVKNREAKVALLLTSKFFHFSENFPRLFIAQQGGAFRGVTVRTEEFALDYAEQAADSRSHGINGTLSGFGVKQRAGVYPTLQVILHLLFDVFCGASGSLYATRIFQSRYDDRSAAIVAALLALKGGKPA